MLNKRTYEESERPKSESWVITRRLVAQKPRED